MVIHYPKKQSRSKYNNKKTTYNGRLYDSKKEAEYSGLLDVLKNAKNDSDRVVEIEYQPPYVCIVNDKKIFTYKADFRVTYADGRVEVIDVKGMKTSVYRIKKKLVEALYGFEIIEV